MNINEKLDDAENTLHWLNEQVNSALIEFNQLKESAVDDPEKFDELERKLQAIYGKTQFELRNIKSIMIDLDLDDQS